MASVIVYISKHGSTARVAEKISTLVKDNYVQIKNLAADRNPDIAEFDRIFIGGSFHAGQVQKRLKDFCLKNKSALLTKEIGIFLCGMIKEQQKDQLNNSFSEEIIKHAKAVVLPGGEFLFEEMNFLEKTIVKKLSGNNKSVSEIDYKKVDKFVADMMI